MNGSQATTQKEVGDLLLALGKLTEQQLEQVRRRQRRLNLRDERRHPRQRRRRRV